MTLNCLKISASLWSANLVRLESEIRRVEPYVDSFHIDVADGTYAKLMLFFPDLVAAVRRVTEKPLEVHLITRNPQRWVEEFAEAGANCIVFYADSTEAPQAMINQVKGHNLSVGIALPVEEEVAAVDRFLDQVDLIVVMGTSSGVKGVPQLAEEVCAKIKQLCKIRQDRKLGYVIEADGAIRKHTVPCLRNAGVDTIVHRAQRQTWPQYFPVEHWP